MAAILADNIFKSIFLNENDWMKIQTSLKFMHRSPIEGIIWTNDGKITDAYMRHSASMS